MHTNRQYIYIKIFILGIFSVPFLCGFLFAGEDSAILKSMTGAVEYLPQGATEWQAATEGLNLSQGDKIKTGADGMVSINFTNGSNVMLKPNAEFAIESLTISDDKNTVDYKLKLNTGKLRAIVGKLDPNSSFTIKTPTAVAAVRGTTYYLNVREVSEDEIPTEVKDRLVTELFVETGGVLYTNLGSGKYFIVSASLTSRSYEDGSITVPIEVPEDKRPEWTEGWELLVPEAYESPEGTDLSNLFGGEKGGGDDPRFGDKINEVIAAAVAQDEELNAIWEEMYDKLLERRSQGIEEGAAEDELERNFLRATIYDILSDDQDRQREAYMERISDAQTGAVLTDIYGNRVRMQQYILRPAENVVEVLNVNLRANNDLTTMAWATTFNQSLDTLSPGELKTLPWNNYLETIPLAGFGDVVRSPEQSRSIYPTSMSVALSHADDGFSESRNFANRERFDFFEEGYLQRISNQELWVKNFNSNKAMGYQQFASGQQAPGKYSITSDLGNAVIGGADNNPQGFSYNFTAENGEQGSIGAAFYVMSSAEASVRQNYPDLAINNIWDALRINMEGSDKQIGDNNLEMVFSGSSVFQSGVIDLIYVPFMSERIEWAE